MGWSVAMMLLAMMGLMGCVIAITGTPCDKDSGNPTDGSRPCGVSTRRGRGRGRGLATPPFQWNQTTALRFVYYSNAAAQNTVVGNWSNPLCTYCAEVPGFVTTGTFFDSTTQAFGYMGYNSLFNEIVISFRGTVNWQNFKEDLLNGIKSPIPHFGYGHGLVGAGWWKYYNSLRTRIVNSALSLINSYRTYTVVVTGHSLGAAAAALCATDLAHAHKIKGIQLYTYGEPRVGDSTFADYQNSILGQVTRVTNNDDPVPHLPGIKMGYQHEVTEVWETGSIGQNFTVCNGPEDPSCSDSVIAKNWKLVDHLTYMHVNCCAGPDEPVSLPHIHLQLTESKLKAGAAKAVGDASVLFDEATAMRFVYFAYSAHDNTSISDWSCAYCSFNPNFKVYGAYYAPFPVDGFAYVGVDPDYQEIVVVFRGTSTNVDAIFDDLKSAYLVDSFWTQATGAKIGAGWAEYFQALLVPVEVAVLQLVKENPTYTLMVAGHSLGGAVAALCATDLSVTLKLTPQLITFGEPRVGNTAYAAFEMANVHSITRITHDKDPVPHLPPQNFVPPFQQPWIHEAPEIWETGDNLGTFTTCDEQEDPSCSDSIPLCQTNATDHLTYMGVNCCDGPSNPPTPTNFSACKIFSTSMKTPTKNALPQAESKINIASASKPAFSWNQTTALRFVYYSYAAGQSELVANWSCSYCAEVPGFIINTTIDIPKSEAFGYIGYNPLFNEIVISFRGTQLQYSQNKWEDLLNVLKYPLWPFGVLNGKVGLGWWLYYDSLRTEIVNAALALIHDHPSYTVTVTGHSLGGAVAALCATDLAHWQKIAAVKLTTYGEPRVGDKQYAAFANRVLGQVTRITNDRDPVPHLPFQIENYQHEQTEVWETGVDGSEFTVCHVVEDPSCSDSVKIEDWDLADHLTYMHVNCCAGPDEPISIPAGAVVNQQLVARSSDFAAREVFEFDQATAMRYVYYAYSSAENKTINNWQCLYCAYNPNFQLNRVWYVDPPVDGFGYIGFDPTKKEIVIVFRGSTKLDLLTDDLTSIYLVNPPLAWSKLDQNVKVGYGFLNYYNHFVSYVVDALQGLNKSYPSYTINVAGHSLGGAVAAICATDLVVSYGYKSDRVRLITFGEPRVGNAYFSEFEMQYVPSITRITHNRDPIPHLPPYFWLENKSKRFQHEAVEVWETGDNLGTFKVCIGPEDPYCADSINIFETNMTDHMTYMGVNCCQGPNKPPTPTSTRLFPSAAAAALSLGAVLPRSVAAATEWAWSESDAMRFVYYSYAASQLANVGSWSACTYCQEPPVADFNLNSTFYSSQSQGFGYIGTNPQFSEIVVAFRGSTTLLNWLNDLRSMKLVPAPWSNGGNVGTGFLSYYQSMASWMISALNALIEANPGYTVSITGHSLGGAVAAIAAVDLAVNHGIVPSVFTYGEPRVGDPTFSSFETQMIGSITRVTHNDDIVPHFPSQTRFQHEITEVWETGSGLGVFQVCVGPEDPHCSDSVPPSEYSIADHNSYMGVPCCSGPDVEADVPLGAAVAVSDLALQSQWSWSEETAMRYVFYSYAASQNKSLIVNWTCSYCTYYKPAASFIPFTTFGNILTGAFGFIGTNPVYEEIVIAFRGSANLISWIIDLRSASKYPGFPFGTGNGQVAKGFFEYWMSVRSQVETALRLLRLSHPKYKIAVTGHSLGGAAAALCATDLAATKNYTNLAVYTFGEPRVGDTAFSQFQTRVLGPITRVTHDADPVPHLPPKFLNFLHEINEVWETGTGLGNFTVCNGPEDPECSDSVTKYKLQDHLTYMGVNCCEGPTKHITSISAKQVQLVDASQ